MNDATPRGAKNEAVDDWTARVTVVGRIFGYGIPGEIPAVQYIGGESGSATPILPFFEIKTSNEVAG